ncbi:N-acetyltransferase [Enterococcus florum]|uniref:N-acetyltransferase n=1 Tax=Enterococcus florum TaxID=2480627 RepID=A0A4P5PAD8_9ENTE|nr:GNAT family N-acetyltransferase [Enterococcus florum]GCF94920.1 N-acetyltransferase [Enterococcus florum]
MTVIRYVQSADEKFWFSLDQHLSKAEFDKKCRDRMGYIIEDAGKPVGLLRYNLFWDNLPFCTMLYVEESAQKKGYGKQLMSFWEEEMRVLGYGLLMTSTLVTEEAQHFYRKLGFCEAGSLLLTAPGYQQPMEMFLVKKIADSEATISL